MTKKITKRYMTTHHKQFKKAKILLNSQNPNRLFKVFLQINIVYVVCKLTLQHITFRL